MGRFHSFRRVCWRFLNTPDRFDIYSLGLLFSPFRILSWHFKYFLGSLQFLNVPKLKSNVTLFKYKWEGLKFSNVAPPQTMTIVLPYSCQTLALRHYHCPLIDMHT